MRKPVIAGNWKMYKTPKESLAFLDAFLPLVEGHERDEILLFPTMSSLAYVIEAAIGTNVRAGRAEYALAERGAVYRADVAYDAGVDWVQACAAGTLGAATLLQRDV